MKRFPVSNWRMTSASEVEMYKLFTHIFKTQKKRVLSSSETNVSYFERDNRCKICTPLHHNIQTTTP